MPRNGCYCRLFPPSKETTSLGRLYFVGCVSNGPRTRSISSRFVGWGGCRWQPLPRGASVPFSTLVTCVSLRSEMRPFFSSPLRKFLVVVAAGVLILFVVCQTCRCFDSVCPFLPPRSEQMIAIRPSALPTTLFPLVDHASSYSFRPSFAPHRVFPLSFSCRFLVRTGRLTPALPTWFPPLININPAACTAFCPSFAAHSDLSVCHPP